MAANHSKRAQQQDGADTAAATQRAMGASFAELGRQQMAAAEESFALMFRFAQGLQQAQLHMDQRAALLHAQAAENIRQASSPVELAAVQSSLMVYGYQEGLRFWQELLAAAMKAGSEALPAPGATLGNGEATSPAAAMMEAAMQATAPMAGAFQQMFAFPVKAAAAAAHA